MAEKKIILTKEERDELDREYRDLIDNQREEVIAALQLARSQGDLSENADYTAARERQTQIESRINEIEAILNNSISAEEAQGGKGKGIGIGDLVTVKDLELDEEIQIKVVGSIGGESKDDIAIVSNESPIGKALLGHEVGDVVRIESEHPYEVKILAYGRK